VVSAQLWKKTDNRCRLLDEVTPNGATMKSAPGVPIIFWPDRSVCWAATMYLVEVASAYIDSETTNKRGTPTIVASNLSFLIRFTHQRRKTFGNLCDDDIQAWVKELQDEKDSTNPTLLRRCNTQVGRIVRAGLIFLKWYQNHLLDGDYLIGYSIECRITIEDQVQVRRTSDIQCVGHRHLPVNSTPEDVKPAGHHNITLLYDAMRYVVKNPSVRKRDENILRLLEATGGRRIEVACLAVDDIKRAYLSGSLHLNTAKIGPNEGRDIPVCKEWLMPVVLYINTHRKKLVSRKIKDGKIDADSGYLFLNTSSGMPLPEKTITKYISRLRQAAGITDKMCAHMFRHRFITIQVATRLKSYTEQSLPMDVADSILTKVAQLTGHQDPQSLKPYIHLAFEELNIWDTSDKVLAMRSKLEGAYREIQTFKNGLEDTRMTRYEILNKVKLLLGGLLSSMNEEGLEH